MTRRRQFNGNRNDGWQRPSSRTENSLKRAGDCRQPWSAFRRTSWLKSGAERVGDSPNEQTHASKDGGQFITSLENSYPICLRNRHRGHKYAL